MTEKMMRGLLLLVATAVAAGCAAPSDEEEVAATESSIVGGFLDTGHPAVGNLRWAVNGQEYASCTATLVAPKALLTAGHCVTPTNGDKFTNYRISFATRPDDGPWYKGTATMAHPQYRSDVFGDHDVALVFLETAPPVKPMPVARQNIGNVVGQQLTHIGTGTTVSASSTLKLGAGDQKKKITLSITEQKAQTLRTGSGWGGICNGDSGGPATLRIGTVETVAAVHSFIDDNEHCLGNGYSTRVDANMDFLARYL